MNLTAKIEQQQNALLLNFFMFIAMTLVVIRTGVVARGLPTFYPYSPFADDDVEAYLTLSADEYGVPPGRGPPSADLPEQLDRLYAASLALLYAAELVARQIKALVFAIYELMKLADALAQSLRDDHALSSWRSLPRKRLDAP